MGLYYYLNPIKLQLTRVLEEINGIKVELKTVIEIERQNERRLERILELLTKTPPVATGFRIDETSGFNQAQTQNKETKMSSAKKATIDFQVLDNGTVQYTATPVDAIGEPAALLAGTALAWTVANSDGTPSTFLTLAPAPSDPSGLTQIGTVTLPTPPPQPLPTGLVATLTATPSSGGAFSAKATPIDVIAGPANNFVVAEQ